MSESPILISLKDAAIAKIEENPKLKMDTVFLLRRDINHMQTPSEVIRFISSNKLKIDTTNLQKTAEIVSPGKPDETAVDALRKMSWEIPILKKDMRFPFRLRYSIKKLGQHEYDVNALRENQNLLLQEKSTVEVNRPQLLFVVRFDRDAKIHHCPTGLLRPRRHKAISCPDLQGGYEGDSSQVRPQIREYR
jgi:hypothetical protein